MSKGLWILGIIIIVVGSLVFISGGEPNFPLVKGQESINIYKSASCGCCSIYSNYLMKEGDAKVNVVNLESMDYIKREYEIPPELESCHTVIVGDYFVEGHIPLEAIEKLLEEKPRIKGIAMSGMPSGSPGMPGGKTDPFVIYSVNMDGSYEEFIRI